MRLPRLVVAAPGSGHGKTTLATGVLAALRRRGLSVSGHKVGPDYIDPGYHALATGRPGRNLDPFLVGTHRIAPLLAHGAAGADVAIIEGVLGLYDGQLGTDGFASTAHVAALTGSPVVLVVDVSHASRSIAAVVHGMRTFDPGVRLVGVVLNKAGSARHAREVTDALDATGLPVLGVLRRDDGIAAPSRHLGLVPAAERAGAAAELDVLADRIETGLDLDALLELAHATPDLDTDPWNPAAELAAGDRDLPSVAPDRDRPCAAVDGDRSSAVPGKDRAHAAPDGNRQCAVPGRDRPLVALAGGRAFTFRYAETEELLRAAGCDTVVLDPRTDRELPAGVRGLYLGGGFPEVYAADLAGNHRLRREIRDAVGAGLSTVAECAGLLYLCRSLDGRSMAGALAAVGTTIVVLMGVRTLAPITAALVEAGLDPATPAAIVADGGLPGQRVETGTVATIAAVAAGAGIGPPAVTVIGAVAGFATTATDPAALP